MTEQRPGRLRVLEAVKAPDGTTRYVDQVVAEAPADVAFQFVSVRNLLLGRYDVAHFHWPEMLIRHRNRWVERGRSVAFVVWIATLRARRVGVVRTMHNPTPHEAVRPTVTRALAFLDARTDVAVAINPTTPLPPGGRYIPHGHYRARFARHVPADPIPGRILYAGLIRPYKHVETLVSAFQRVEDDTLSLRIVGKATPELATLVHAAVADGGGRVSARLEFVSDEELVHEMTSAQLVCLPYRELHNSGILLVALSLNRPVLVPDTPATRAIAREVGAGWVHFFDGDLDGVQLRATMAALATTTVATAKPDLSDRDWSRVGGLYAEAFESAARRARSRPRLRARAVSDD